MGACYLYKVASASVDMYWFYLCAFDCVPVQVWSLFIVFQHVLTHSHWPFGSCSRLFEKIRVTAHIPIIGYEPNAFVGVLL